MLTIIIIKVCLPERMSCVVVAGPCSCCNNEGKERTDYKIIFSEASENCGSNEDKMN